MALRIIRNKTDHTIYMNDISTTLLAHGEEELSARLGLRMLSESDDLARELGAGNVVLDLGDDVEIGPPRSIDIVRQWPQYFKTTADDKLIVNSTPQPGAMTDFCLTSRTDSQPGSGDLFHIDHTVFMYGQEQQSIDQPCGLFMNNGGTNELSTYWLNTKYLEFDVLGNRTFFYDGGVMWRGLADNGISGLMALSMSAVSSIFDPTDYEVVPGTGNCALVGGYLLVPMPGLTGGTHSLPIGQDIANTPQPLKMTGTAPMVLSGLYYAPAFWRVDYDLTEEKFFNLLPMENPYSERKDSNTGDSNIVRLFGNFFAAEIPLMGFVRDFLVIGNSSNFFGVASQDATEIPCGVRIRLDCKTVVSTVHANVAWTLVGYIKTYRENTV
jgi:hypothetical protein